MAPALVESRFSVYPPGMDRESEPVDRESEPERVVIRAVKDPPTADTSPPPASRKPKQPREPRVDGKTVDTGMGLAILGSILAAFGPLLPWWKVTTPHMGIQISTVTGTGAWFGVVAFVGGITALSASTYLYVKPERRGTLGLVILGAGAMTFACSAFASFDGKNVVHTIFRVGTQLGIPIALAGGLISAVGGYLLAREGSGR